MEDEPRPPTKVLLMSSPQLEDGYFRVANELMEAILGFGFSQRELLVLLTIMRKTYGFQKKEDDISASQIGEMCKLARTHVTSTLNQLAQRNIVTKRAGRFGSIVGIQKNSSKWLSTGHLKAGILDGVTSTESVQGCTDSVHVPNQYVTSTESVQVDSTDSVHTKDNLPKENQQKKVAREERTFKQWIESCKESTVDPIPEDDPVFAYADEMAIPIDFIRYAWVEFKRKYSTASKSKKYKNWNQHFQNAIRENWYGIWYEKDGGWLLTTRGKQIEMEIDKKAKAV